MPLHGRGDYVPEKKGVWMGRKLTGRARGKKLKITATLSANKGDRTWRNAVFRGDRGVEAGV